MTDLADFLLARISEDEAAAREAAVLDDAYGPEFNITYNWARIVEDTTDGSTSFSNVYQVTAPSPTRVLAECEAKRRIVTDIGVVVQEPFSVQWPEGYKEALEHTLRVLVLPYTDHPDYRQEWRP